MVIDSPDETLRQIKQLLDDQVPFPGADEMTLLEHVQDLIDGLESWSDLAVKRLHQIHHLSGTQCAACPKYLEAAKS
ncbi:MAG: hypothetical protein ACTHMS_00330 [Jatrophihabitans sp.]|uniref:hypothetical protein n=1 Tax=Jatrophihabitans sp. TaxID=1932789 RepID=UPI003F81ADCA